MEGITLEDLRRYQHLKEDIAAIEEELRSIYVSSPAPNDVIGGRASVSTPGDPTARKAMRAIERKEQLEQLLMEREKQSIRIEAFIDRLDDLHIAAIMRWHYILGLSWGQTCMKIYGYADSDICRKAVHRYFRQKEE